MNLFEEEILNNLLNSVLIIVIMVAIYMFVTNITKKSFIVSKKIKSSKKSLTIMKLVNNVFKYLLIVIGALMILGQFGFDTKGLIASLGVAGAIAGLAFKDVVQDFIVGISIITDNQYEVGDFITIGGFKGEVIEVGMQTTKIKNLNGDVKIISNGTITEVINHSKNPNTITVDIPISYDSDLEKVEKVLNEVCEEINKNITYLTSDMKVLGIENLADSAIMYRLCADVEPMKGYQFKREVFKTVKKAFDKDKIEIPYNQLVIHNEK